MTITPERLRDLGAIAEDFGHPIYAHALRDAADEIERLYKRVGDQLARISQLEQLERGHRQ